MFTIHCIFMTTVYNTFYCLQYIKSAWWSWSFLDWIDTPLKTGELYKHIWKILKCIGYLLIVLYKIIAYILTNCILKVIMKVSNCGPPSLLSPLLNDLLCRKWNSTCLNNTTICIWDHGKSHPDTFIQFDIIIKRRVGLIPFLESL